MLTLRVAGPPVRFLAWGVGRPFPPDRSVAMRVVSPLEWAGRWMRRFGLTGLLLLLGAGFLGLEWVERSIRRLDEQVDGRTRCLLAAQEHLWLASGFAAEAAERAEEHARQALDLLRTVERPPPMLVAAALEQLGTLLERRGELESARWMLEESRGLGAGAHGCCDAVVEKVYLEPRVW